MTGLYTISNILGITIFGSIGIIWTIVLLLIVGALSAWGGFYWHKKKVEEKLGNLEEYLQREKEKFQKEKEEARLKLELEFTEKLEKARRELESEYNELKKELNRREERLEHREETLQRQSELLSNREADIERRLKEIDRLNERIRKREEELDNWKKELDSREKEVEKKEAEAQKLLEKNAGMSREEAKQQLKEQMISEARNEAARQIRQIEEELQEESQRRAQRILSIAMQRYASEYVSESTVSVVHLPSEDMKGRIIGREGRNIRALEAATGVDIIIDDTPEAVVISCFDPIRREIGRRSLEKLVSDGRIHPARIEEVVEKTTKEMDKLIKEAGEEAVLKLDIHRMHPELKKLLGRLKWRYSYGQNQWEHSIESGFLCGLMAAELGLNVKEARRAALLHDIGKALSHELEGSHAINGGEIARKYGEKPEIVHAIQAHHEEIKPQTPLAYLVIAADALSGGRPGARRESVESYIKRLKELEEIAYSFEGVEKAYAIQAGREIRVITSCDQLSDDQVSVLCRDIARKIEREMTYPGQIKVTVIRETRVVDYAR